MKPDISEFSYGYALTSELIRLFGLKNVGAPVFPSLQQEGWLGYDVQIPGVPLFLQFKLSDYTSKASAKQANVLGVPHYRMYLRPLRHSDQHELLRDLEGAGFTVFYATPEFYTPDELNRAYDQGRVAERSAFWAPSDIGVLPNRDDHYVAFRPGNPIGYLCSEPMRTKKTPINEVIRERLGRELLSDRAHLPSESYFLSLRSRLLDLYSRRRHLRIAFPEPPAERPRPERDARNEVAFIAQTLFGCALLFALRG